MELLFILFLTLFNAVFAMSEMALASSRRARLEGMHAAGDAGAGAALALMAQPTRFLSTVQVGITSIGVLTGIVGDAAFSPAVAGWFTGLGVAVTPAGVLATALVVTCITFISIIFGELVPKRIGLLFPEIVARWVSRPMAWLAQLAKPFVWLLTLTTQAVLKLLRVDANASRTVTEEEIAASLEEGVDAGLIEAHEHEMVRNVFRLDERALASMMLPRSEVLWFDGQTTVAEALAMLKAGLQEQGDEAHLHSWYPVCKGLMDHVIGVVGMGDLLRRGDACDEVLADMAAPATFVPETLSGMELLEQFRLHAGRMVFVVDEYGELQGILTPRDLLEAITGELQPETPEDAWAVAQENGSWLLEGLIPPDELKKRLAIEELPDEDEDHYNTLAGLLMYVSGEMPVAGQQIECAGWNFEIVALDGMRIDKVVARKSQNTG